MYRDCLQLSWDKAPDNTVLCPILFTSKSLTNTKRKYSNIEKEALSILYRPEKFHHYYFICEVPVTTDHTPLVTIFKKDGVTLAQRLQWILLHIHQYRIRMLYKPSLQLYRQTCYPGRTTLKKKAKK